MAPGEPHSFWDSVRAWGDSAGLLLPPDPQAPPDQPRARVPQAVCDSCPICQAAATLDRVNPQVVADLAEVARSVVSGFGSALTSAADLRTNGGTALGRAKGVSPPAEETRENSSEDPMGGPS